MITNKQYQRLMSEYKKTGKIVVRAMKADVHPQTARKYLEAVQPPAELQAQHLWRTRPDPVAGIWEQAEQMLSQAPELEAKELFEYLCGMCGPEAGVPDTALRTFQRRVLAWRLQHGPDKEVFFAQEHLPGKMMQLDWTNANELGVTIAGRLLEHLLCHSVLPYSNWEWANRCPSESLLSLRHGLQESLHQLGVAPERLQIDNRSAATHRVGSGGREFNPDFLSLVQHYGMKPQTIGIDCPEQNGDVESQNGHLKRRLKQHLLLRGYRDFATVEAYDAFVVKVLHKANDTRRTRLAGQSAARLAQSAGWGFCDAGRERNRPGFTGPRQKPFSGGAGARADPAAQVCGAVHAAVQAGPATVDGQARASAGRVTAQAG